MALEIPQRPAWNGEPKELHALFRLHKDGRVAVCKLFTHQLGWECRLFVGAQREIVQTQVCRSDAEIEATTHDWRLAMEAKGWA